MSKVGIQLSQEAKQSVATNFTSNYLRVKIEQNYYYPNNFSMQSSDFTQVKFTLKNNDQAQFSEGAFALKPAQIEWSYNNIDFIILMTGFISKSGGQRNFSYITNDYLQFTITDSTSAKGTKRKIEPQKALVDYYICNPNLPAASIVHVLAKMMGVNEVDCGLISERKDIVYLEKTPWEELKELAEAYNVNLRFTNNGKLWFHSPLEELYSDPELEWTLNGDSSNIAKIGSPIIKEVTSSFDEVYCNKATMVFDSFSKKQNQEIFRLTENYDKSTRLCNIQILPGETYPKEGGVLNLEFKLPVTGEEISYAINIKTPTVGTNENNDIYATSLLTLEYFNANEKPNSAGIRLKNNTGSSVTLRKLVIFGEPFLKTDEITVEEKDAAVTDEVDIVDKTVSGKYINSLSSAKKVLGIIVGSQKFRSRNFKIGTTFLPQLQTGMKVDLRFKNETVVCVVKSFSHLQAGKTFATLRTDLELRELKPFTPSANPIISSTKPSPVFPEGVQGLPGFSTAQVRLMKRSKTIPANYNGGSVTYTFSTGAINFENNNNDGWALTPLTKEGDVYVIYASANAQTLTDEIKASEFTPPVILSEEAVAGKDGANVQTVFIFNTSLTTPALPSLNATHNFKTGLISGLNNNWKNGVEIQDGDKIWISTATAFSYSESDSILPIEWNTPTLWKVKGDKGEQGIQGPQGEDAYQIQIYSSGGNAFRVGKANTTLTAYVFQGADDITDTIDSSLFRWIRKSQGTALADDIWNTSSKAVGKKQVFITPEDTIGRTVFSCEVDI